jgi:hypothetical protein
MRWLVGTSVIALTLGLAAAAGPLALAGIAPRGPARAPAAAPATAADLALTSATWPPEPRTITLLSGDRVVLQGNGGGVQITPGPGRAKMRFIRESSGGHHLVIPADAIDALGRGQLDRRLFDVTALAEFGYDDEARSTLPLIIKYTGGAASAALADDPRPLGAGMVAVSARKNGTAGLWSQLVSPVRTAADAGIDKVWLDGKKYLFLDRSVPQIGAPQAWTTGLTGKCVKVAVLDSGYDPTHPDLKDNVLASKNFTAAADIVDQSGHGTHVASTIAGTGAASGGTYKGVAPDAQLLIGKVCTDRSCPESAILSGMRWAAESGARVVNISVGTPDDPGVDPIEEAVKTLTATTGTLFVVSAGNSGPGNGTVASPGSADEALTVGAVDRDDKLAPFSSRGPRVGDGAVKPDLTAPGVAIVAARAKDTTMGEPADNPQYTGASGTSMASPHVSGAAAIVAQQHPDWKAAQIKEMLVNTAAPVDGTAFEVGSGRVDVVRATTQPVSASPASLSFGVNRWPHTDDKAQTRSVTFRNASSNPITLNLELATTGPDGKPAVGGMFAAPKQVAVPATGASTVDVTVSTGVEAPDGWYTAVLTATGDNKIRLRTAISVNREPESYDETLTVLNRAGEPADHSDITFVEIDTGERRESIVRGGKATARLPKGRWTALTTIVDDISSGAPVFTLAAAPGRVVDKDGGVTLDARKGEAVGVTVPNADARLTMATVNLTQKALGNGLITGVDAPTGPDQKQINGVYVIPTAAHDARGFSFHSATEWANPAGRRLYQQPVRVPRRGADVRWHSGKACTRGDPGRVGHRHLRNGCHGAGNVGPVVVASDHRRFRRRDVRRRSGDASRHPHPVLQHKRRRFVEHRVRAVEQQRDQPPGAGCA